MRETSSSGGVVNTALNVIPGFGWGLLMGAATLIALEYTPLGNYTGYVVVFLLGFLVAFVWQSYKMMGHLNEKKELVGHLLMTTAAAIGMFEVAEEHGIEEETKDRAGDYRAHARDILHDLENDISAEEFKEKHGDFIMKQDESIEEKFHD